MEILVLLNLLDYLGILFLLAITAALLYLVIHYCIYEFRDVNKDFFFGLFHPVAKITTRKVISCKSRIFLDPPSDIPYNLFGPTHSVYSYVFANRYFLYLENEETKSRYFVLVNSSLFEKIKKHKVLNKDVYVNIFENKYFLLGSITDHIEIEESEVKPESKMELVMS
jgi:hypothetical protein